MKPLSPIRTHLSRPARTAFACALVVLVLGLYLYGAMQQITRVNLDLSASDQRAYMGYAIDMVESDGTFIGERNRMPVYPFLQSLFYRPGMSEEAFFRQGKVVNLILSVVLLLGLSVIVVRRFGRTLHALNVMLIIAFTVFAFKAGWFQVELLFYALYFCLFVLLWRLLHTPSYRLAALAGVVAGVAHLTKAAVLPGLALFLMFMGLQLAWNAYRDRKTGTRAVVLSSAGRSILSMLLIVLLFLLTVFPYISTSKRVFGRYFYNVNSTFYAWYDSWDSVKRGTRAHEDASQWPDMPASEIPSMSKYLREHTTAQIIGRFRTGARSIWHKVNRSYGYFKYLVFYAFGLSLAGIWQWRRARQLIQQNPVMSVAGPAYFAVAFLLCAWFAAIDGGDRFLLIYFAPLLFLLTSGMERLLRGVPVRIRRYQVDALTAVNLIILAIVIVDVYVILTDRIGWRDGGS